MTSHAPPTEAKLEEMLSGGLADSRQVAYLISEIRRLRELCGRAEPFVRASAEMARLCVIADAREEFADELRAASKGEL